MQVILKLCNIEIIIVNLFFIIFSVLDNLILIKYLSYSCPTALTQERDMLYRHTDMCLKICIFLKRILLMLQFKTGP